MKLSDMTLEEVVRELKKLAMVPPIIERLDDGIKIIIQPGEDSRHVPHVHVIMGEFEASIEIDSLKVTTKKFPERFLTKIKKYIKKNRSKLHKAWDELRPK